MNRSNNSLEMFQGYDLSPEIQLEIGAICGILQLVASQKKTADDLVTSKKQDIALPIATKLVAILTEPARNILHNRLQAAVIDAMTFTQNGVMFGTTAIITIHVEYIKEHFADAISFMECVNATWKTEGITFAELHPWWNLEEGERNPPSSENVAKFIFNLVAHKKQED